MILEKNIEKKKAVIIGTGSYVPDCIVSNEDLSNLVDTNDEWIKSRTGIENRRIAVSETTADLAFHAAEKALEAAGVTARELDLIICATMTPDYFMPSTACLVQERLGAAAAAFDLSAACSGFVYALTVGAQFIESGMYRRVLVVGADKVSKILDWSDRSTCVLFGDGAGAAVLSNEGSENTLQFVMEACELQADGKKYEMLTCRTPSPSSPFSEEETGTKTEDSEYLQMNGGEVFKFAVKSIVLKVKETAALGNTKAEEIDFIIPHQANIRIIEQAAKMLKLPAEKFFVNLDQYGNTSAGTIGLALDELACSGRLKQGDKVMLVGFGGGMTSGAVLLTCR